MKKDYLKKIKNENYPIYGIYFFVIIILLFFSSTSNAGISLYGEGVYNINGELSLGIYADISEDSLLSAGIKISYNASELTLSNVNANKEIWFMGDGSVNYSYMEPETNVEGDLGSVIIILGKFDSDNPDEGVLGNKILCAQLEFNCIGNCDSSNFGFGLSYGKVGNYKNFVTVNSEILDNSAVTFNSVLVYQLGDANEDGTVNDADIQSIKDLHIYGGEFKVWEDCNEDGVINLLDITCIGDIINREN